MTERTRRYSEGEIGDVRVVEDFLPVPDQLVKKDSIRETNKPSGGRKKGK